MRTSKSLSKSTRWVSFRVLRGCRSSRCDRIWRFSTRCTTYSRASITWTSTCLARCRCCSQAWDLSTSRAGSPSSKPSTSTAPRSLNYFTTRRRRAKPQFTARRSTSQLTAVRLQSQNFTSIPYLSWITITIKLMFQLRWQRQQQSLDPWWKYWLRRLRKKWPSRIKISKTSIGSIRSLKTTVLRSGLAQRKEKTLTKVYQRCEYFASSVVEPPIKGLA